MVVVVHEGSHSVEMGVLSSLHVLLVHSIFSQFAFQWAHLVL